ncbi:MAG: O-antigen ligase family protein [Phycisphaerales bacterium]
MQPVLAQFYGFEYSGAVTLFMAGFGGLALLAALMIRLSAIQWILVAMLFFTALSAPVNYERTQYVQTWMLPVQMQKASIHLALGLLLTLVVIVTNRLQPSLVPVQGLFILAISLYAAMLQFIHETPTYAAQSLGFALGVVPCMLFAAPSVCRSYDGCVKMLRAIMVASVAWTVCCSVQFVINPRMLVNSEGGRFWGMNSNAQGAALTVAPFAVIALWLLLNDHSKKLRLLWLGLVGINLIFLGWTGSRTGLLMLLAGAVFVLYRRMGRVVLFLPIAAVVTFGLSVLSDELQIANNLERLTDVTNTREGVWAVQISKIAESPVIGVGWKETGASESSFLGGFAAYGMGMFLIMTAFLVYSMWRCAQLTLLRGRLPREQRPMVDVFVSFNAMYFASAVFEGHMLARSAPTQTMMLMFAGIGVWLAGALRSGPAGGPEEDEGAGLWAYDSTLAYEYSRAEEDRGPAVPSPGA